VKAAESSNTDDAEQGATLTKALDGVQLLKIAKGNCLQVLHVGPYAAKAEILSTMHNVVMPSEGLTFNGAHHEIYLGDPRKTDPSKLRTILRQPVRHI